MRYESKTQVSKRARTPTQFDTSFIARVSSHVLILLKFQIDGLTHIVPVRGQIHQCDEVLAPALRKAVSDRLTRLAKMA